MPEINQYWQKVRNEYWPRVRDHHLPRLRRLLEIDYEGMNAPKPEGRLSHYLVGDPTPYLVGDEKQQPAAPEVREPPDLATVRQETDLAHAKHEGPAHLGFVEPSLSAQPGAPTATVGAVIEDSAPDPREPQYVGRQEEPGTRPKRRVRKISARAARDPAAVIAAAAATEAEAVEIAADAVVLVQATVAANVNIDQDQKLTNSH